MKILFLINNAFGIGGTIRTTFNLAGALAARGHDVEVLSTLRNRDVPQLPMDPAIRLTSLVETRPEHAEHFASSSLRGQPALVYPKADYRSGDYDLFVEESYRAFLRASDADVVIATRAGLVAYAAQFAPSRMIRIGQEHLTRRQQRKAMREELPRHIKRLDAFVTVSARDAEDYRAHLGRLGRTELLFIPNSVPQPALPPSDGSSRIVVAAGRLVASKRYDVLIRAFAKVVADHPDWQLRIYGGGTENAALRRLVLELDLHNHVLMPGGFAPIDSEWARGSIAAVPSDREPFGMTLVEAMRCGLPVVSTDAPHGPREILQDGVDGLLTPVGDADAMAQALLRMIGDAELRTAMATAALANSARYDPDPIAAQYEQLFERVAARKRWLRWLGARPRRGSAPDPLGPVPTPGQPVVDCTVTADGEVLLYPARDLAGDATLRWRRIGDDGAQPRELAQDGHSVRLGDLPEGAWELRLQDGRPVAAGMRDTRTLTHPEPPGDGGVTVHLPYRTPDGTFAVRSWRRAVHAEVGAVFADDTGLHVEGRLIGAEFGTQAPVLRACDGEAVHEEPGRAPSPTRFRISVPALAPGTWQLWLEYAPGAPAVRLGRFLDDVADKRTAYVLPAAEVGGARLQPEYTGENELSVRIDS
ncbi:glycosyltransferase involved in cell wall biosynthesis [Krasilnikovia cinnamomea]|uniref:Glycosyltransferase involved in cell wall biosynthesis n=1 Tax=Krasilnikovia cinnamomea TaxID=349313 RepID=A0A4Q7ZRA6_9ACTN|nr:glycosyltransferase family 4 protein [Krasilnikovia cinnamomea]RZU53103.1 glycosyltransferase involved in cell wall biosynthesis [Krasilnikovia cinnamomea]